MVGTILYMVRGKADSGKGIIGSKCRLGMCSVRDSWQDPADWRDQGRGGVWFAAGAGKGCAGMENMVSKLLLVGGGKAELRSGVVGGRCRQSEGMAFHSKGVRFASAGCRVSFGCVNRSAAGHPFLAPHHPRTPCLAPRHSSLTSHHSCTPCLTPFNMGSALPPRPAYHHSHHHPCLTPMPPALHLPLLRQVLDTIIPDP